MILHLALTTCLTGAAPAQEVQPVTLNRVLAIEQADSPFGRHRLVFSVTAPLPPPRAAYFDPQFWLGDVLLKFPGEPGTGTVLHAYFDEMPKGAVPLRITSHGPFEDPAIEAQEIPIEPEVLLRASRLIRGEFEPAHVRRSIGRMVDLGTAWSSSEVVVTGRFADRDTDLARANVWHVVFDRGDVLRNPEDVAVPERMVFFQPTPPNLYELGARYVLFVDRGANGGVDPERLTAVRLWQPRDDFVLRYLEERGALGDLFDLDTAGLRRARRLLYDALESPAAEVRLAAVNELLRSDEPTFAPTPGESVRIRARAAVEPAEPVRRALVGLVDDGR